MADNLLDKYPYETPVLKVVDVVEESTILHVSNYDGAETDQTGRHHQSPHSFGKLSIVGNQAVVVWTLFGMWCKLDDMWAYGTFGNRQKIQNLVFPAGITWNRDNLENLTKIENETFKLIRSFPRDYEIEEQQKKEKPQVFSLVVDQAVRISNLRFMEGLLEIRRFIEVLHR